MVTSDTTESIKSCCFPHFISPVLAISGVPATHRQHAERQLDRVVQETIKQGWQYEANTTLWISAAPR
jgi:hypothetical protein